MLKQCLTLLKHAKTVANTVWLRSEAAQSIWQEVKSLVSRSLSWALSELWARGQESREPSISPSRTRSELWERTLWAISLSRAFSWEIGSQDPCSAHSAASALERFMLLRIFITFSAAGEPWISVSCILKSSWHVAAFFCHHATISISAIIWEGTFMQAGFCRLFFWVELLFEIILALMAWVCLLLDQASIP